MAQEPVMRLYHVDAKTQLHTDTLKLGLSAILLHKAVEDNSLHPVYYYLESICVVQVYKSCSATHKFIIGMTPFELLTGTKMKLKNYQKLRSILEEEFIKVFQQERSELRDEAMYNIMKIQQDL